jgi:hypothetical protein
LLGLLGILNEQVGKLDGAVQQAAEEHPKARLPMTEAGMGPNTARVCADTWRCQTGASRWRAIRD